MVLAHCFGRHSLFQRSGGGVLTPHRQTRLVGTGTRETRRGHKNDLHLKAEYIGADFPSRPQCPHAFMRRAIPSVYKSNPLGRTRFPDMRPKHLLWLVNY